MRRDLLFSVGDGVACTVMVACGEMCLPLFAVAAGLGAFGAAAVATVPPLVGAGAQLLAPVALGRVRSIRRWVVGCVVVQALSFLPIAVQAARGRTGLAELLLAACLSWSAGMASLAAWNVWMAGMVPLRIRPGFFALRTRLAVCGMVAGMGFSGVVLFVGERWGMKLSAFALLFGIAMLARLVSAGCMAACGEPRPRPEAEGAPRGMRPAQVMRDLVAAVAGMASRPSGPLVAYLVCFVFGTQMATPYLSPYLVEQRHLTEASVVCLTAVAFVARILVLPALGGRAARQGPVRLLRAATLALACVTLLWLATGHIAMLAAIEFAAGASWAAHELAVTLLLFNAVGDRERVAVVTLHTLGSTAAAAAGAACGGMLLRGAGGGLSGWAVVFVASAAMQLAAWAIARRLRPA